MDDNFDFDPEDSEDPQKIYIPRTLSQGSPILIETHNESLFIGNVITAFPTGILIAQTLAEITPEELLKSSSHEDFALSTPIETFLPFTAVHFIQSMQDISEESMLDDLRQDLENYHKSDEETPSEYRLRPWDRLIVLLDRLLKRFGV